MVAPTGDAAGAADRINRDVVEILGHKEVVERGRGTQMEPVTRSARRRQFFAEETAALGQA